MCVHCAFGSDSQGASARRAHLLALLALVEHPTAVPADAALRLGQEVLALVGTEPAGLRCEPAIPSMPQALTEDTHAG